MVIVSRILSAKSEAIKGGFDIKMKKSKHVNETN
jgi:hypothetical protein